MHDQTSFGYEEQAQQFNESEQLEPEQDESQDMTAFIQELEAQKDQLIQINNQQIEQLDLKDAENAGLREDLESANLQLQKYKDLESHAAALQSQLTEKDG